MKKVLVLTLTLISLAAASPAERQRLPKDLKDGGGPEPPCPVTICGASPGLLK